MRQRDVPPNDALPAPSSPICSPPLSQATRLAAAVRASRGNGGWASARQVRARAQAGGARADARAGASASVGRCEHECGQVRARVRAGASWCVFLSCSPLGLAPSRHLPSPPSALAAICPRCHLPSPPSALAAIRPRPRHHLPRRLPQLREDVIT
ncbi:hypothetical protein OF83DRAFT_1180832 [Amylostereum chailletii]|nr:hypothetical protein OF83DRAFT_1180832 [Amylostereum chailletii]